MDFGFSTLADKGNLPICQSWLRWSPRRAAHAAQRVCRRCWTPSGAAGHLRPDKPIGPLRHHIGLGDSGTLNSETLGMGTMCNVHGTKPGALPSGCAAVSGRGRVRCQDWRAEPRWRMTSRLAPRRAAPLPTERGAEADGHGGVVAARLMCTGLTLFAPLATSPMVPAGASPRRFGRSIRSLCLWRTEKCQDTTPLRAQRSETATNESSCEARAAAPEPPASVACRPLASLRGEGERRAHPAPPARSAQPDECRQAGTTRRRRRQSKKRMQKHAASRSSRDPASSVFRRAPASTLYTV